MCHYRAYILSLFNDTATTDSYTLSLHDALPILCGNYHDVVVYNQKAVVADRKYLADEGAMNIYTMYRLHNLRSEEHTSELQSLRHLVCRLLLEKKKHNKKKS